MELKVVLKDCKNEVEDKLLTIVNRELDCYDVLVLGEKFYVVGMMHMKMATVKEISFNSNPKDTKEKFFTCPYCGYVDKYGALLTEDIGETFCSRCGSDSEYEKIDEGCIVRPKTSTRIIQLD